MALLRPHGLREEDVLRSRGEEVLTSDDVGDPVVHVVDGRGEVIRRRSVRAEDHEVVDLCMVELHVSPRTTSVNTVRGTGTRDAEPDHSGLPRLRCARREILRSYSGSALLPSYAGEVPASRARSLEVLQLFGRGERVVRLAFVAPAAWATSAISLVAIGLAIRPVITADGEAFIPLEAQPSQVTRGCPPGTRSVDRARSVSSDLQHEDTVVGPCEEVVVQAPCGRHPTWR